LPELQESCGGPGPGRQLAGEGARGKSTLVADLQQQIKKSGNFLLSLTSLSTFVLSDQYFAIISAMQMLLS
jgi:hypothetical protein